MLSAKEYVEISITRRLNKRFPNDLLVEDKVFLDLMQDLDNLINYVSTRNHIMGFLPEDIESFLGMKVHQSLRRGLYDFKRPHYGLYKTSFNNLLRDIVKTKKSVLKHTYIDPIEECFFYNEKGESSSSLSVL